MDCSQANANANARNSNSNSNTDGGEKHEGEAEEKSDFERSEKAASTLPTFGTNLSVFSEVPRGKNAATNGLVVLQERNVPLTNRAEAVTVPVKILPVVSDLEVVAGQNEPPKLPEFVDWSARTTSAMYKKLEQEVSRLRCDKQQAEERLDRSLQQTELDREVIKRLQQDLRQQREKVFEYERQIRASKISANRQDERDSANTSSAAEASQQTSSANDALNKEREQKLQKVQFENDLLKRKIDELDEVLRRNDRIMRSVQEENRELRSRLDTDATRFATFEERIKQLEDALTRASQDNLQLIDQMRSQLLAEQARRAQLEQMNSISIGATRAPPTRKTLTETASNHIGNGMSSTPYSRVIDAYRPPGNTTAVLSSPSEKEPSAFPIPTTVHQVPEKNHHNETASYGSTTTATATTAPTSSSTAGNMVDNTNSSYSLANQPGQTTGLSGVSNFGLRRYLSLPPGARRQLTSRFFGRLHDAPTQSATAENGSGSATHNATNASTSQFGSVYNGASTSSSSVALANRNSHGKVDFDVAANRPSAAASGSGSLPWSSALHYDSAARSTAGKPNVSGPQLTSMHPIVVSSLSNSNKKLPAVPAVVDQTAVQQANRLNLQEYRDFLKDRRRKMVERETLQMQQLAAAAEMPTETV